DKVKQAGGVASSSVTKKLHYLVVGDEGSPLFGQGKKGDKQVKAEELNASGVANIRIISETAFLQMLEGGKRQYSEDAALAGAERGGPGGGGGGGGGGRGGGGGGGGRGPAPPAATCAATTPTWPTRRPTGPSIPGRKSRPASSPSSASSRCSTRRASHCASSP